MKLDTRKYVKYMILVFLSTLGSTGSNFSCDQHVSYLVLKGNLHDVSRRIQEIVEKFESSKEEKAKEELLQEEEKLLIELWAIAGRFYKKIIEITALYCSGHYSDSYSIYDHVLVEISRDIMHLGKIVTWYIPTLVGSPHIPLRVKVKKCVYISSALGVVVLWMKELYKYNKEKQKREVMRQPRFEREPNFHGSNYYGVEYGGSVEENVNVSPRLRQRDF